MIVNFLMGTKLEFSRISYNEWRSDVVQHTGILFLHSSWFFVMIISGRVPVWRINWKISITLWNCRPNEQNTCGTVVVSITMNIKSSLLYQIRKRLENTSLKLVVISYNMKWTKSSRKQYNERVLFIKYFRSFSHTVFWTFPFRAPSGRLEIAKSHNDFFLEYYIFFDDWMISFRPWRSPKLETAKPSFENWRIGARKFIQSLTRIQCIEVWV